MFGKKPLTRPPSLVISELVSFFSTFRRFFGVRREGDFRPRISKYFVYGPIGPHLFLLYVLCQISLQFPRMDGWLLFKCLNNSPGKPIFIAIKV